MNIAKRLTLASWILLCVLMSHVGKAQQAEETTTTTTTTTKTVVTETKVEREETKWKPLKVCVLEFTTIDIEGQKRFQDVENKRIVVPPQNTLNDADHQTMNSVMQGFVRMIDAWDNTRTNQANRDAQVEDNAFARDKALDIYRKTVQGEARPVVMGANYLRTYLGGHSDVFACMDNTLVGTAMMKISQESDFPRDFMHKVSKATGTTHLIKGMVSDIYTRELGGEAFGIKQKTVDYSLDINIEVVDLELGYTVFSGSYTGNYTERRPHSNVKYDNAIYTNLLKIALQKASDAIYEKFKPQHGGRRAGVVEEVEIEVQPMAGEDNWQSRATVAGGGKPAQQKVRDKLGVMMPANKGRLKVEDIDMIWSILESIEVKNYRVISRAGLKQMMEEIDLEISMDLVNLDTDQRAKLGRLEGVKYLLISEVGTLGTKISCTMRLIDSSTGEVVPNRRVVVRVNDLDELGDVIESYAQKLFEDDKQLHSTALLAPAINAQIVPGNLADDFMATLENYMLEDGFQIQNLKSVSKILARNGMDALDELEPKMYVKAGKLLEVEMLMKPTITKFELQMLTVNIEETGRQIVKYIGAIDGNLRIISAQTGNVVGNIPLGMKIDFYALGRQQPELRQMMRAWTPEDYHKYMLQMAISQQVPQLRKYLPRVDAAAE
ncbi:MAG: hypothetical protein J6X49_05270 [Victivallales bacterium]|nr:hypothetical protein [Victivallales bacterium]